MIDEASSEHPRMPLKRLCELFGVSRSWYYQRLRSSEERAREEDIALRDAVERIVLEFPGYGYRRVTEALRREGWTINHKKVLRVMRKESLLCQLKRRFKPTTDSGHPFGTYPNLIKDAVLDGPDRGWVADITYIRLPTTFCYLASILDDYSRKCVGWHLSRWIDTRLTLAALQMALGARRPQAGLIHHSERVRIRVGANGRPDPHSDRLHLDAFPRNCRPSVAPSARAPEAARLNRSLAATKAPRLSCPPTSATRAACAAVRCPTK